MSLKILIRAPNHLGDCIMALSMINETREAFPGSSVTVLVPEYLAELFEQNPAIDDILRIPRRYVHGLIGVVKIKEIIAGHHPDVGIILPPSFGAASAFKLAGVKERIGYITDGRRLLLSRPLPLPTPLNAEHRSKVYFDLLRRASSVEMDYVRPKLFLNESDDHRAAQLLDGFGICPDDDYVAVAFRAVAESRRWRSERYAELASYLVEKHGLKVVLAGSEDDRQIGDEIAATIGSDDVANLAGKTSLRELAAIFSGARLFVGNDSGPAHLAASVGVPLVVLSGADDPSETSPISNRQKLIYLDHLDCISCVKNRCPLRGEMQMRCMNGITLEMVISRAEEALRGE